MLTDLESRFNEFASQESGKLFSPPTPTANNSPFYFAIYVAAYAAGMERAAQICVESDETGTGVGPACASAIRARMLT